MVPLNGKKYQTTTLLALLLCFDLTAAATTLQDVKYSRKREIMEDGTLNCETERSSDYYGLGVRIGVYFAWFQAWIANICVPSEISNALDTNAIFLFAILLSMVRCTITDLLLRMDGLMLMHMGGGTIFSVLSVWGYRTCTYDLEGPKQGIQKFGGWGTHFRLLLCMAISTFGLFFWAWGLTGELSGDPDPGCEVVYTFMFAKVRADGGIRIFYIIICIGCMLYFGIMLLASLIAIPSRLRRSKQAREESDPAERVRHKFATGLSQKQLRQIFYFLRIANLVFIIYTILLIEFTLNFNHIAGVLGWRGHIFFPSQVIPMIIGAFGFCRVIWARYQQWKLSDDHETISGRSILNTKPREFIRIYSTKSDVGMEFASKRPDWEMDPLLVDQPIWLRMLVSWLPWLGVLRCWEPERTEAGQGGGQKQDLESTSEKKDSAWSPNSTTTKFESIYHRDTWESDETAGSRLGLELPQVPRNIARFGSLRR